MSRFWFHDNPLCDRPACGHPLRGERTEGHFYRGDGPCKASQCTCRSFRVARLQRGSRPRSRDSVTAALELRAANAVVPAASSA